MARLDGQALLIDRRGGSPQSKLIRQLLVNNLHYAQLDKYYLTPTSSFSVIPDNMTMEPQFLSYTIFQKSLHVVSIGPCVMINFLFCL